MAEDRAGIVNVMDRNLMAAYIIVKGTPGIAKSKLYFTPRGRRVVEWMIDNHYISQRDGGCYLGFRAEEIGPLWEQVARDADQDDDIEALVRAIAKRYSYRLDYLKERYENANSKKSEKVRFREG